MPPRAVRRAACGERTLVATLRAAPGARMELVPRAMRSLNVVAVARRSGNVSCAVPLLIGIDDGRRDGLDLHMREQPVTTDLLGSTLCRAGQEDHG